MNKRKNAFIKYAIHYCILGLFVIAAVSGQPGEQAEEQARNAQEKPLSTIDKVIDSLYTVITFERENAPDWALFRSLFAPNASLTKVEPGGVNQWDADGFIANFQERIDKGVIASFYEGEINRQTKNYGGIAQVISVYEKGTTKTDKDKLIRGVNLIQMIYADGRWWIISLIWQDELSDVPIPKEFFK